MAQLGPITVTVSVSLGATRLPVKPITFDVDLNAIEETSYEDRAAKYSVNLDRTSLRAQFNKAVRHLGDQIEGAFLTHGTTVITCDQCEVQLLNDSGGVLRHESDGSHSIAVYARVPRATPAADVPDDVAAGIILGIFSADTPGATVEDVKP